MNFIRGTAAVALVALLLPAVALGDEDTELKDKCTALSREIGATDKKFPLDDIKDIVGLVTWRASQCEKPPKGAGNVTRLCDATLASGGGVFFWEKKTKNGKLRQGFYVCK